MKGLKEFIEDLAKDNKLREKFKDLKDVKEIVSLAKKEGYEFTEDEYMDKQMEAVSGGIAVPGGRFSPCVEGSQRPGWKPNLLDPSNLIGPRGKK